MVPKYEDTPVLILAGGKGTRLGEHTQDLIPKPMVNIGEIPMLQHIVMLYRRQGLSKFAILGGHLIEHIDEWRDSLDPGLESIFNYITVIDTLEDTGTGWRISHADKMLGAKNNRLFFVTYGDGLANVNMRGLWERHHAHGKACTLTAPYYPPRFGVLDIGDAAGQCVPVRSFGEKSHSNARINGGFFLMDWKKIADGNLITGNVSLEYDILPKLAQQGELFAYKHDGYWQMMDTPRDVKKLHDDMNSYNTKIKYSESGFQDYAPWTEGL